MAEGYFCTIRDASLADIWERGLPLRYTRDRTVKDLWGFCAGCYYADACRAAAAATSRSAAHRSAKSRRGWC